MTMAWELFDSKTTKRMKAAILEMEEAVAGRLREQADAEDRLREKLEKAKTERMPVAGSLVWRGARRDG